MAQLPSALACHLSSVASSEVPLAWTAKSMMVVVPPQAAARVPVSKVSEANVPPNGISMCVCTSIPPGSTYLPVASMTWSAASANGASARRARLAGQVPGQQRRDPLAGYQHVGRLRALGRHHGAAADQDGHGSAFPLACAR